MKFLVSKNIHTNPNFKLLIAFYSFLLLFYFIGDLFYLAHFFGADPHAILTTLKGNADEFIEPLSLLSLLEHIHISLFLGIMALFTTMAILLRLDLTKLHTKLIISFSMGAFLFASLSLLAGYFFNDNFVALFFYATILWHLVGIYTLFLIFIELGLKRDV
jgi:hypothetical protein